MQINRIIKIYIFIPFSLYAYNFYSDFIKKKNNLNNEELNVLCMWFFQNKSLKGTVKSKGFGSSLYSLFIQWYGYVFTIFINVWRKWRLVCRCGRACRKCSFAPVSACANSEKCALQRGFMINFLCSSSKNVPKHKHRNKHGRCSRPRSDWRIRSRWRWRP